MKISIVAPVYNEAEGILHFHNILSDTIKTLNNYRFEIIYIDDGSQDDSFNQILKICSKDNRTIGLKLSRNFGHQAALSAGLEKCSGDAVIMLDSDLQHPPKVIPEMIALFENGHEIVSTKRIDSNETSFFKKSTSKYFYQVMNALSEIKIEASAADFRLMSRKALNAFLQMDERSRFIRGMSSWIGFKQSQITFIVEPRFAGKSKYTVKKMFTFALEGITSFSAKPLRLSFYLGLLLTMLSIIYTFFALTQFFQGKTNVGWTSTLITILLLGGVQLISIGIVGEYIAKIYKEVKNRPVHIIDIDTSIKEL